MTSKTKLVFVGGGGHFKSVLNVIQELNEFQIVGVIDNSLKAGGSIHGVQVLGNDDDAVHYISDCQFIITIGQVKQSKIRAVVFDYYKKLGAQFATIIASSAVISKGVKIGEGTVILSQAFINTGVEIGVNCIVNTGALLEHDVKVGNHSHISTRSVVNGEVAIGARTMVGSNATLIQCISVGDDVMIGAGSVVVDDVCDRQVVVGNPAKKRI